MQRPFVIRYLALPGCMFVVLLSAWGCSDSVPAVLDEAPPATPANAASEPGQSAPQLEHTNLPAGFYPEASLERIYLGDPGEESWVGCALLLGTTRSVDQVFEWYRKHYEKVGRVEAGRYDDIELELKQPTYFVRVRAQDERRGQPPLRLPFVQIQSAPATAVYTYIYGMLREPNIHTDASEIETKIMIIGEFPAPASSQESAVSAREREELVERWRTNGRSLVGLEEALDRQMQCPGSLLTDVSVEEGVKLGYVTVRLTFVSSASVRSVVDYFMTSLAQLGVVVRAGDEEDQHRITISLHQDGLSISQLCVEANSECAADPGKSTADTAETKAQSEFTWYVQRRAPWLFWELPRPE